MNAAPDQIYLGLQALYRAEGEVLPGVSLLGSGFEADVFAFSLREKEASGAIQDLALRLYFGDDAREKAAREFAAMDRLRAAGYPVPRVRTLQTDPGPLGRPCLVMERIQGVSLESAFWTASEEERPQVQARLFRLMAALHALPATTLLPEASRALASGPFACVDRELATLRGLHDQLAGGAPPSLSAALAGLLSRRASVPCTHPVVVHGDFHRNNVLVRADAAPFVIDWSNVRPGDRRTDLAWTRLILRIIAVAAGDLRPERDAAELGLYERLAGQEIREIAFFEEAACLRLLLSTLVSLRFGAARQGMHPGIEARMRQETGPLRYAASWLQGHAGQPMPDLDDTLAALAP